MAKRTDNELRMPLMIRGLRWLDKRSPAQVCIIAGSLIVSIGFISDVRGPLVNSSLFYLIPILLVTRALGFYPGLVAAFAAATMKLAADLNAGPTFTHPVTPYWNAAMRMGTFGVVVSLVAAMRSLNEHLEERVIERTAALEAQMNEKRELEKTILEISDSEQARIGQDLHDGLCQQLVSAAFSANMLQANFGRDHQPENPHVTRIADMIDDAITQARNLARGLYPVRLETEGLEMALRELAATMSRRFDTDCTVDCPNPIPSFIASSDIHFYRIAQEAVINAAKHAQAKHIVISLASNKGRLRLSIDDDGIGIGNCPRNPDGMGLRIMEYRARMIGATFRVENNPHHGTEVTCEIESPIKKSSTHERDT